jgi:hypothetical protein
MSLLSSTIKQLPRERKNPSDLAFGVGATIILIGLAILSVALGVPPTVDPAVFPNP